MREQHPLANHRRKNRGNTVNAYVTQAAAEEKDETGTYISLASCTEVNPGGYVSHVDTHSIIGQYIDFDARGRSKEQEVSQVERMAWSR
jgi:hypothetical protein